VLILAFDTSGFSGSVALLDGSIVLGEQSLPAERRSAQTLAPAMQELLQRCQVEPRQVRLVATTVGPGSFTGLRVGITTAKAFAYAVEAEVLGISTLETIAHSVPPALLAQPCEVQAVLDAQRKELFLGQFHCDGSAGLRTALPALRRLSPGRIISADAWLNSLPPGAIISGTGLTRLEGQWPPGVIALEPPLRQPQASVVGRLAWRDYQAGRRDDLWKLAPVYLRPSYAEEKAAATLSTPSQ
jgi:tRNA threonylcarbamoyladenosine biosynthesis protein TsaB